MPWSKVGVRYPFQYSDALFHAFSSPRATMLALWSFRVSGNIDADRLRRAMAALARCYPVIASTVPGANDADRRVGTLAYECDAEPDVERLLRIVDAATSDYGAVIEQALRNRPFNIETDYPLQLTVVRTAENESTWHLSQHHCVADGVAIFELLAKLFALYDADTPLEKTALVPCGRRDEIEALAPPLRGLWWKLKAHLWNLRQLLRVLYGAYRPLSSNWRTAFHGPQHLRRFAYPAARFDALRAAAKVAGHNATAVLVAALARALWRWDAAQGEALPDELCFSLPVDLRPRDGWNSWANHISALQVRVRRERAETPGLLEADVTTRLREGLARREPEMRLICDNRAVLRTKLGALRRILDRFGTRFHGVLTNLAPLSIPGVARDGKLTGGGLTIETLWVTSPLFFPLGLAVSVFRYGGELIFNVNSKEGAVTLQRRDDFVRIFREELARVNLRE